MSADCNGNGTPDACELVPVVFGNIRAPVDFGEPGEPRQLASGDLDGDGFSDFVVAMWQDRTGVESQLRFFLTRGAEAFSPEIVLETTNLSELATADLDLVTRNADVLQVYPNDGTGGFAIPLVVATSPGMRELEVVDVDVDGRLDLVTLNFMEGSVTWYRDPDDGPLGEGPQRGPFGGEEHNPGLFDPVGSLTLLSLAASDLDGDGDADLAIVSSRARAVTVFENQGSEVGGRRALFSATHSLPVSRGTVGVEAADLSGDGLADLVVWARETLVSWRNLGAGGFEELDTLRIKADTIVLEEIDGDGSLDLLIGRGDNLGGGGIAQTETSVRLLRGSGDGNFQVPQTFSTDGSVVGADDFDGDGDLDLAIASHDRTTFLFQGERGGLVFEGARFAAGGDVHFLDAVDLNGDGISDVATANRDNQTYSLLFGRGDGSLGTPTVRALGRSLEAVVAPDLNRDGSPDLVFRSFPVSAGPNAVGGLNDSHVLLVALNEGGGELRILSPSQRLASRVVSPSIWARRMSMGMAPSTSSPQCGTPRKSPSTSATATAG